MLDHDSAKIAVLEDLMEKMREMEGGRLKPKAIEVSMESVKPGPGVELHEDGLGEEHPEGMELHEGAPDLPEHAGAELEHGDHEAPDGNELSPEDLAILDQLFGGKEEEQC